MHFLNNLCFTR